MLFLVEYDRSRGKLDSLQAFEASCRQQAADARLALELSLHNRGIEREVVILEAASEAAIRRTHGRYFKSLEELAQTAA